MSQPQYGAPQPPVQPQYPQQPPVPPKKSPVAKIIVIAVAALLLVALVSYLALQVAQSRTTVPIAPAASPTPYVPPPETPVAETPIPETPSPQPPSTYLTYAEAREGFVGAYPMAVSEKEGDCASGGDFQNDDAQTAGLYVIKDDCLAQVDTLLGDFLGKMEGTRYKYYVRGTNWVTTFETPREAATFAVGAGLEAEVI